MKKRQIIILASVIGILGLAVGGMYFFSGMKEEEKPPPQKAAKRYVKAKTVKYTSLNPEVIASGRINTRSQVDLISEVQGKILSGEVELKKGQGFKKGDLLVRIFDDQARLGLKSMKSRFMTSVANMLPDMKIDFSARYPAWQDFFNRIDISEPMPELPDIKSNQEKVFLATRNILNDYYTIKSEQIRVSKYKLYAPFKGSYSEVMLEVGAVANPGTRIAKMIRTDRLEVEIPLEPTNARWAKPGKRITIMNETLTKSWEGKIIRKSEFVDPGTQMINIYAGLDQDKNGSLFSGAYMKARFKTGIIDNVMEIPRKAVFNSNQVYTVQDSLLKKKVITIIKSGKNNVIFNGLDEGTELVVEPLVNASENMKVSIIR
ncbi:MAG: efflux RND transporter periplasmic adaptor subunit [Bacteroidales bacterium]|nr:efflux RND transporter periplasmic adaptor subunit [Bacteroidales bacterium]